MPTQADLALKALGPTQAPAPAQSQADLALAAANAPGAQPRTFLQSVGDMTSAFGHHVMAPLHGAAQFVENSVAKGANMLPDNPVSRAISRTANEDNNAIAQWERKYQSSTPDGWGASTGAVAGTIAPMLVGGVANGLKAVGDGVASRVFPAAAGAAPSVVARVVSGATQGGVLGAAQPVTDADMTMSDLITGNRPDYWGTKGNQVATGAAWGGVMPALGAAGKGAWDSAKAAVTNSSVLNPAGYAARNIGAMLGQDAPQVATDLRSASQYVPGSVPSSAQAAADPRLVMLEKQLANQNPTFKTNMMNQENANNAARLQAVRGVAQDPQALAAAIKNRSDVTAPMRQFTVDNGNPVPVSGIQSAISSVASGPLGVRPTIGSAASGMQGAVDDMTSITPPNTLTNAPGSAVASPAMLDALRQNANDYLAKFAPNGVVGSQEQAAMMPVKASIIGAIDAANPGHKLSQGGWGQGLEQAGPTAPSYRDYLAEFAKRSVPINTMELGQELHGKLAQSALNSGGDAGVTFSAYRSALAQALKRSDYGIDPDAQKALEAVQSDLQRSTISNSVRTPGSDTAFNKGAGSRFLQAIGAGEGGGNGVAAAAGAGTAALTGSTNAGIAAALGAKKASGFLTNRVSNAIGDLMLDPQKLAAALQAQSQPATSAVPPLMGRLGGKLTPAMAAQIALMLQQQQQPQVVQDAKQGAYAH